MPSRIKASRRSMIGLMVTLCPSFSDKGSAAARAGVTVRSPPGVNLHVAAVGPVQLLQPQQECRDADLTLWIVRGQGHEHADAAHPLALRACAKRPRCRRAAEQRDELATFHSITSSARASRVGGTSRPSAFAVLRLITSSYFTGAWTGRPSGL